LNFWAILAGNFRKELATLPSPVNVHDFLFYTDDASMNQEQTGSDIITATATPRPTSEAQFLVPDLGEEAGFGVELLHRPISLCNFACRYDNSTPKPVSSPLSWTKITATGGD
jgi:hypothetical protein